MLSQFNTKKVWSTKKAKELKEYVNHNDFHVSHHRPELLSLFNSSPPSNCSFHNYFGFFQDTVSNSFTVPIVPVILISPSLYHTLPQLVKHNSIRNHRIPPFKGIFVQFACAKETYSLPSLARGEAFLMRGGRDNCNSISPCYLLHTWNVLSPCQRIKENSGLMSYWAYFQKNTCQRSTRLIASNRTIGLNPERKRVAFLIITFFFTK